MLRSRPDLLRRAFCSIPLTREQLEADGISTRTVYRNLHPTKYYEMSITIPPANPKTQPSLLTSTGAYAAYSGERCGRSPKDKRLVTPLTKEEYNKIWWSNVNKEMSRDLYGRVLQRAQDYLNNRENLFAVDGFVGWDPKYRKSVRIYTTRPYHALFMNNMLVRPSKDELKRCFSKPDFIIYNAGEFYANKGTTGKLSLLQSPTRRLASLWIFLEARRPYLARSTPAR